MRRLFFLLNIFCSSVVLGQHTNLPLGNSFNSNLNELIYDNSDDFHTSFKPLIKSKLIFSLDSIKKNNIVNYDSWFLRKIFNEHLFELRNEDFELFVSPVMNFSFGREVNEDQNLFTNTRGFMVESNLGDNLSFSSSFFENQSIFPNYLYSYIKQNKVVPGQGYARTFKENGFDYAMASGYVSYRSDKFFSVQFGHGKHFIGDGYRSLFLSDNSFNYPYLMIQTDLGKIQYTNLYAEFMDINYFRTHGSDNKDQIGYPKKYMSSHHLSYNLSSKFNISLYESVIWRMNHAPGSRGFDVNYLNPISLLRPIEFSLNSPDNVLIGISSKYIFNKSYLYSQLIVDEFSLEDLKKNNGFWGNKYGYQIGFKKFNSLSINNLTFQVEYNYVRPYTYAHHNPQQNYAHYNQPLAHPLGANFSEMLFVLHYKIQKLEILAKYVSAQYGGKIINDPTSYGNDLFYSTGNYAEENDLVNMGSGRPSDFGIEMYQGNHSFVKYLNFSSSYVVNPLTNLKISLSYTLRNFKNDHEQINTSFISFGLMTDLFNNYYDF